MSKIKALATASLLMKLASPACDGHATLSDGSIVLLNKCFIQAGGTYAQYTCDGSDVILTEYSDECTTATSTSTITTSSMQCETVGACEYFMYYSWTDTGSDKCGTAITAAGNNGGGEVSDFTVNWLFSQISGATIDECIENTADNSYEILGVDSCSVGTGSYGEMALGGYHYGSDSSCGGGSLSGAFGYYFQHPYYPGDTPYTDNSQGVRSYTNACRIFEECSADAIMTGPTEAPTFAPTEDPTSDPTTAEPTSDPTSDPTTAQPTDDPTEDPTSDPTSDPTTAQPTADPTTAQPTEDPTTAQPTTAQPTTAAPTTAEPTTAQPTEDPTTAEPTTAAPTTAQPTNDPTEDPTTAEPTTAEPTNDPTTAEPTITLPTDYPTSTLPGSDYWDNNDDDDDDNSSKADEQQIFISVMIFVGIIPFMAQ